MYRTPGLDALRTVVHGDSKMDNFLYRRTPHSVEDDYQVGPTNKKDFFFKKRICKFDKFIISLFFQNIIFLLINMPE